VDIPLIQMSACGRFPPVGIIGFLRSERPVVMKANTQIADSEKLRLTGRFAAGGES